MIDRRAEPFLLTPGPLTTSRRTVGLSTETGATLGRSSVDASPALGARASAIGAPSIIQRPGPRTAWACRAAGASRPGLDDLLAGRSCPS